MLNFCTIPVAIKVQITSVTQSTLDILAELQDLIRRICVEPNVM